MARTAGVGEKCGKTGHLAADCWAKDGEMRLITEAVESLWVMAITDQVGVISSGYE